MEKKILQEEKEYLKKVESEIDILQTSSTQLIKENKQEIEKQKEYFANSFYEGDNSDELASVNLQIEHLEQNIDRLEKLSSRLKKQKKNPYFGRFDFKAENEKDFNSYYIGIGHIQNNEEKKYYVYDWRADISSLYYDDAKGKVSYTCPAGEVHGNLNLKRQYKIENGVLKYYIDSSLVIDDNILMEELSKSPILL